MIPNCGGIRGLNFTSADWRELAVLTLLFPFRCTINWAYTFGFMSFCAFLSAGRWIFKAGLAESPNPAGENRNRHPHESNVTLGYFRALNYWLANINLNLAV
jgi:hypothetical protein